ncbi:MAG: glnQ 6, partial [Tardiphaga sp.]|nr:glnQ 6 [Tardiphaga sp.]
IYKSYGNIPVIKDLSFRIDHGEVLAIVGRSGSGKSTLLKCINLIDPPDQGEISLDGDVYVSDGVAQYAPWEVRRHIGLVFQEFHLFPNMTVMGNITLALRKNMGLKREAAEIRALDVARALKIDNIVGRYPSEISTGQAQRCALARAIVLEPKVFLLDEITSALDPVTILDVVDAISSLRTAPGTEGMSIVLVTHLIQFAARFADRIAFFHDGTIHEEHSAVNFFDAAHKPETRALIEAYAGNGKVR